MGQSWLPVNLDRHEFIHPHKLTAGLKLCEQAGSWPGTGAALVILCAAMPESRGGGDLQPHPAVGRWAGDRIAIVGDYAEDGDLPAEFEASKIVDRCRAGEWTDVSEMVCDVLEREYGGKFMGRPPADADGNVPADGMVHRGEGWRKFVENAALDSQERTRAVGAS